MWGQRLRGLGQTRRLLPSLVPWGEVRGVVWCVLEAGLPPGPSLSVARTQPWLLGAVLGSLVPGSGGPFVRAAQALGAPPAHRFPWRLLPTLPCPTAGRGPARVGHTLCLPSHTWAQLQPGHLEEDEAARGTGAAECSLLPGAVCSVLFQSDFPRWLR